MTFTGALLLLAAVCCAALVARLAVAWLQLGRCERELKAAATPVRRANRKLARRVSRTAQELEPGLDALERSLGLLAPLRPMFVVYGFPRTGNSTLAATVGSLDICDFVFGGHHFSDTGVCDLQRAVSGIAAANLRERQLRYWHDCTLFNRIFHEHARLREVRGELGFPKPFVVTAVRDPVAIYLSGAYFVYSCLDEGAPPPTVGVLLEAACAGVEVGPRATLYRDLWFRTVCGRVDDGSPWHREMDRWFRRELASVFRIDAFGAPFPHERGWTTLESDLARCLLVRQEDFDRLPEILANYFGIPEDRVTVIVENAARDRRDATLYAEARDGFRLPKTVLDEVYASDYVRHFYGEKEIDGMRARWAE
jgi:hypothetical protein